MSDETIEKAARTAEGLLEKGTFDLIATIKGSNYPTKDVTIATDLRAMHLRDLLEKELNGLTDYSKDAEKVAELEARVAELEQVIKDSSLTFHLEGLPPHIVEETEDEVDAEIKAGKVPGGDEERNVRLSDAFMAKHIKGVTRVSDGAKDTKVFEAEDIKAFRQFVPFEAWKKIRVAMDELTFAAAYFDGAVSADFLPKS